MRRSTLARQAVAEFVGTALLLAAIVGSGIAAQRLSPNQVGLELLENSTATAAALVAIILAVGPVSGAHLNPLITLADRVLGGLGNRAALVYIAAQLSGGIAGVVGANLMFGLPALQISTKARGGIGVLLAEAIATLGLLLVVFGVVRSRRSAVAPFAVGAYIGAAYWFTSSTSFANPAVDLARMLSNTFAGIAPASVPAFIAAQLLGAGAAVLLVAFLYPSVRSEAERVLVPHEVEPEEELATPA